MPTFTLKKTTMKLLLTPILLFVVADQANAVVTLGQSTQNFVLTGIGANSSGQGVSKMGWGTCTYDGTNTTCTLSGPFTGFGKGGTYSFVVVYPGNGEFPLNAVSQSPGNDRFFAQATGPFSFTITLAENGGPSTSFYSFANFNFVYANATCTGNPPSCGVGQVGLTPNATISGHITGAFDPTPVISPNGVINASNYGGSFNIAPATWIEIYGVNLATTPSRTWSGTDFNGIQAPTTLAGTTVTVGGKPAYVDYVSPGQVNVQVPSGVPSGPQQVLVTTAGGTSVAFNVNVNSAQPGLLAPLAFSIQGKQYVVALFSNTLTYVLPIAVAGVSTARAKPGDSITLYGIGFGTVTPDIPAGQIVQPTNALQSDLKISLGGVQANITYAGLAPNYVGLYQFNVVVPNIPASDSVPLTFSLGGVNGTQNLVISIAQ